MRNVLVCVEDDRCPIDAFIEELNAKRLGPTAWFSKQCFDYVWSIADKDFDTETIDIEGKEAIHFTITDESSVTTMCFHAETSPFYPTIYRIEYGFADDFRYERRSTDTFNATIFLRKGEGIDQIKK